MANRKATLVWYCRTPEGWRRYPAVMGRNGRVRPGYAQVGTTAIHFPEGHYQVRFYEGSKLAYKSVGDDAQQALNGCIKHARLLEARNTAGAAGARIVEETGRVNLARALAKCVQAAKDRGHNDAANDYKLAGEEFLQNVQKTFADQINADDLLRYQRKLRDRGSSPRTIHNRHVRLKHYLRKYAGVSDNVFPERAPRYEKKLPEIYSREELERLFSSLGHDLHRLTFTLALKCGLREQELMHLQWADIDFRNKTLKVCSKPSWGFSVKDKEERLLPLPDGLLELLSGHREANPNTTFVIGTSHDKPNTKLLRTLKRFAHRSGLNCSACSGCQARNECERWFLHKFRATFCTTMLRNGIDLRTVQKLMGHSDLESTMRYLRPQEDAELQARVNSIKW